ncbi:hypothetical protein RND81_11G025400 [Saponaria officinalis]|uniref:NPH3 domain-containing protein n=1 Tax=Saponaria officinalis TaxID=3572 RepID=A0AAW1HIT6_SAPOF
MDLTNGDASSWISKRTIQPNIRFSISNAPLKLDKGLLAKRSAKIAAILEENPYDDLAIFFQQIKPNHDTLELIARFCHGFQIHITSNNIIPLICLSHQLQMTETHSPNNLLEKTLTFLEQKILNNWDESIKSLRASSAQTIQQAIAIGLFNGYLSALTTQALSSPSCLVGSRPASVDPSFKPVNNATRRKLFVVEDHSICSNATSEELTSLPLYVYEPVMDAMARQQVPKDYITASLFQYLKNHQSDKQVIEAIERLLPGENYVTTPLLLELYALSVSVGAGPECITGLETRIGKQLDRITLKELLALDLGVENLRQILKGFYGNYNENDTAGLIAVAELMEKYLIEIAKETSLETSSFTKVAEMVSSTSSVGSYRCTDGIYRAVDVYLDTHRELSEPEKEAVCQVLEFEKMSKEACGHATQNPRLPLRVVVQALFVAQLQLRDDISKAVGPSCNNSNAEEGEDGGEIKAVEEEEEEEEDGWGDERWEIVGGGHRRSCCGKSGGRKKVSLWKEVKRKFGCMSSENYQSLCDCNCQVKKRKKFNL